MSQAELKKLSSLRVSQIRESRDPATSLIRLFFNALRLAPRLPQQDSVTPSNSLQRRRDFEDRENVQELSYGTDNRMAKPVFVGQVYTNTGANRQQ
jgi:hypothetical protein